MVPSLKSVIVPRIQRMFLISEQRLHKKFVETYLLSSYQDAFTTKISPYFDIIAFYKKRCEDISSFGLPFWVISTDYKRYHSNTGDKCPTINNCRCGDDRRSASINLEMIPSNTFYYLDLVEVLSMSIGSEFS